MVAVGARFIDIVKFGSFKLFALNLVMCYFGGVKCTTHFNFFSDYEDIANFTWADYLSKTKSVAVPTRAFKPVS